MEKKEAKKKLIRILQNAHAGEMAAAFAYRGHWKSLKESPEKKEIKHIEAEEWKHRQCVFSWLKKLEAEPKPWREKVFWTIGRVLGFGCFLSGWFFPMYFAGRLESQNVQEYLEAAKFAKELDLSDCEKDMLEMAETEQKHEDFFKIIVQNHFLLSLTKFFFRWG